MQPRTIFITGTDTGVGKTVLTALLLTHLRRLGRSAMALKPFCSGGRADAQILHALQNGDLTLDQINPFYFPEPLAPLVAARLHRRKVSLTQTMSQIQKVRTRLQQLHERSNPAIHQSTNPVLLVEGAGGLLAPLGEDVNALELIKKLNCEVLIASANRLGTINHTVLTVRALQMVGIKELAVVLMDLGPPSSKPHHVSRTNPAILAELLAPVPFFRLPNLPKIARTLGKTERKSLLITCAKKLKKTLARIIG